MNTKQLLGQFYTTTDPFNGRQSFKDWFALVPPGLTLLEPFAGGGHIMSYVDGEWDGYDIDPSCDGVIRRDTISEFPQGYSVCITNPPYLAKTVVSRKKLPVKLVHEDLYLDCLELMLNNCDYVCAIIPSTFWNTGMFRDRLYAWDKFDMKLFSDTDAPAGVAYFVPNSVNKTRTFVNGKEIHLRPDDEPFGVRFDVRFNEPSFSDYLVNGIDTTSQDNIHIKSARGCDLSSLSHNGVCKSTNRNTFPVSCPHLKEDDLPQINKLITEWRQRTNDFYLTNFKSCQHSGKYRKRISFKEIKWILWQFYRHQWTLE